ncbi:hypothetical protein [Oceanobacillus indicireducens]|uniref:Uncharacterized protein n=1 Tax=Oceanobacillus indicireducens TaxID=1004261 RepID=A0A918D4T3_9BACI|nr:hypothetical protein [Oceanobacillus indicireducens]GGN64503.1 hypothetical protein GCM10007971_32440 [Oceanobacillus indicireducens]
MEHLEKVNKKFSETAYLQEMKGIQKYGKPLDPMDNYDWLEMAAEEQVDGYKYLIAEMEKRKFVAERIRTITERCDYQVKMEINHWLDELEGTE